MPFADDGLLDDGSAVVGEAENEEHQHEQEEESEYGSQDYADHCSWRRTCVEALVCCGNDEDSLLAFR